MKNIKTFENFINESHSSTLNEDDYKGLLVTNIYRDDSDSAIIETPKGLISIGCMGGAMISFEGDAGYGEMEKTIVDCVIDEYSIELKFDDGTSAIFVDDTGGEGVDSYWENVHEDLGAFNMDDDERDEYERGRGGLDVKDIESKIQNAAWSIFSAGTMTKQASFINGAKWAISNLTDEEIKYMRENSDPDDHSFFGL